MKNAVRFALVCASFASFTPRLVAEPEPARATEGDELILKRLFPKAQRFAFSLSGGTVLNPAFVDTSLATASASYFLNETWGLGFNFSKALTRDRGERRCIETFYNDPKYEVGANCMSEDDGRGLDDAKEANIGPAYVPIRELRQLMTVYLDYTLAYGKQIFLHGATGHFDLRVRFGGGLTQSDYYAERTTVRGHSDRPARGGFPAETSAKKAPGVAPGEHDQDGLLYGTEGRPAPERQSTPHLYLGVAEELLFLKRFNFGGELSYYMLLGTPHGPESFIVANVELGMRL